MFDVPADIPKHLIQDQCRLVYEQFVPDAPSTLRQVIEREKSKSNDHPNATNPTDDLANARDKAIQNAALRLGAQQGLLWRQAQINATLETPEIQSVLSETYDFSQVITEKGILYPVVREATFGAEISPDGRTARMSQTTLEIVRPAKIVLKTPTWRDWLIQPIQTPQVPVPTGLLPASQTERELWRAGVCKGFEHGVRQANTIFSDRLTQLTEDYKGMLRFQNLVQMGMISMPEVQEGRLGVTMAKSGQRINIDDRTIQIVIPERFTETQNWRPVQVIPLP